MAKKNKKSKQPDNGSLIASIAAGGIGLLLGLFVLSRRSRDGEAGSLGAIDRALGTPSTAAGDGGDHEAVRADEHFRPDPTAPVAKADRDAFAPATLPNPANPNAAQPAM